MRILEKYSNTYGGMAVAVKCSLQVDSEYLSKSPEFRRMPEFAAQNVLVLIKQKSHNLMLSEAGN